MGSRSGGGVLRLGGLRDVINFRDISSAEMAAARDLYGLLQIALADRRRLSIMANGRTCRFARRRNGGRVFDDSSADHRRAVDLFF